MPFTAAHPAAVLPLRRFCPQWFVWPALIVGSITPDTEYFLALRPQSSHGVTFAGSFYYCVPIGLLLLGAFHLLLRQPLALLLPKYWRDRLMRLRAMGLNTVCTYVPWMLHQQEAEESPTFEGALDLLTFLKEAQDQVRHLATCSIGTFAHRAIDRGDAHAVDRG